MTHNNSFDDEFKQSILVHIPHSGTYIPKDAVFSIPKKTLKREMDKLSDYGTDVLFDLGTDITHVIFPYNRVYCDVERLPDDLEVMYQSGRGFYYTKRDSGKRLRGLEDKEKVRKIYTDYHNNLAKKVNDKLEATGSCLILDCHSFSDKPFDTDLIKEKNRPDFCLGTDDFHTPKWLLDLIKCRLEDEDYTVGINNPYSGTIVPLEFYRKNDRVHSIMIEVNRKLFTDINGNLDFNEINRLNSILKNILE